MLIAWMATTVGVLFIVYTCVVFAALIPGCVLVCTALYASACFLFLVCFVFCSIFKLIKLSTAMSGIPNSTCPFLGTTKNIHLFLMFLHLIWTAHVPDCIMCVPLYVFNLMFPFTDLFKCSLLMFANNFQNVYSSIRFPSLTVLILYRISNTVFPTCISNFAIMSDLFLFIYN